MVLIVEDGTGKADAESYNSLAEVEAWIAEHGGSSEWLGIKAEVALSIEVQPTDGDQFVLGSKTYTLQTTLTDVDGNIAIGASVAATRQNVSSALDISGTAGTQYATSMTAHPTVEPNGIQETQVFIRAQEGGDLGNAIASTSTFTSSQNAFGAATLTAGVDPTIDDTDKEAHARDGTLYIDTEFTHRGSKASQAQALEWPRVNAEDDSGFIYDDEALPARLKDAHALATLKASSGELQPDSVQEGFLIEDTVRVEGAILETKRYAPGGRSNLTVYRKLEGLLRQLVETGGVIERA